MGLPGNARVLVLIAGFAAAVALQWRSGAYGADWSADADEPAHYVTGLMVKEWAASGFPWPPMAFAEKFYSHYPKVGLGHWPPLFYVVQGAWGLVWGSSRASMLLLMAALTAWLAADVFGILKKEHSTGAAIGGTALLLTLPAVQDGARSLHTEILTTLLVLRAAVEFGRYLDTGEWRRAGLFGVWACLAILSKASGIVLAAVAAAGVVLTGRYGLLRKASFWLPAGMVIAGCGPWYALAPGARHEAVARYGRPRFAHWRLAGLAQDWNSAAPFWLWPFAAAGLRKGKDGGRGGGLLDGGQAALAAVVAGSAAGRVGVLAWEAKHLLYATPPMVMLAVGGASRLRGIPRRYLIAPAVAVACAGSVAVMPPKMNRGYVEAAGDLVGKSGGRGTFLICADAVGEGAFIAEVALRESAAGRAATGYRVERGSKLLARSTWQGERYELLAKTPEEAQARMERAGIEFLVLDRPRMAAAPHFAVVEEALRRYPDRWARAGVHAGPGGAIEAYRLVARERRSE